MPFFHWLGLPENASHWDNLCSLFEQDRGSRPSWFTWFTWFPVEDKLINGSHHHPNKPGPDAPPLLVDIAGGRGHDLLEFRDKFPGKGPIVLQDQPGVLAGFELPRDIEKRKINFFTEVPVPGK